VPSASLEVCGLHRRRRVRSLFGGRIWDSGLRGADWRKQVAAVTAGSCIGAVLVVAGRASYKNVFVF